jgi:hypothetical protein
MLVNELAKLDHSKRNAVSAALIVIAALAMYKWMVTPHTAYLSAAKGYEFAMDNIVKKNKIINNKVQIQRQKLQDLHEQSAQLQSILFTHDQAREFFSDLQAISDQADCSVHSLNFMTSKKNPKDEEPENTSGILIKSAVLCVVGQYNDIARLIERLQGRTQKVWIDAVKVRTIDFGSDQPKCDITITICEISDEDIL